MSQNASVLSEKQQKFLKKTMKQLLNEAAESRRLSEMEAGSEDWVEACQVFEEYCDLLVDSFGEYVWQVLQAGDDELIPLFGDDPEYFIELLDRLFTCWGDVTFGTDLPQSFLDEVQK